MCVFYRNYISILIKDKKTHKLTLCIIAAQNQRFCPASLPENLKSSPPPGSCCSIKKQVGFYFHVLAVGSFSSLITFRGRQFVPHRHPPFTPLRSVHFTHLSTAQHRWFSRSIPQSKQSFHFAFRL